MSSTTTSADAGQDISWIALLVIILVLSVTVIIVGLRIYTRLFLVKQLGLDDYCVVVTTVAAVAVGGAVLSTIPYGLGRHTATLDVSILPSYLRNFWLSIVLYNLALTFVKLTFLFQYQRVLSVHKMKRVIWTLGTIIMMWAISQLLVVIFTCTPVDKFWNSDKPGHCIPDLPFWYINAAGNIATDIAIFAMPLPVLRKLQLRTKQKYFLIGIFSLGFFTCAISLIRLAYLNQGPDFTFDNVSTSCWSVGEVACGICCVCLPTLRPLVSKLKPHWMSSYATRKGRRIYGYGVSSKAHDGDGHFGTSVSIKAESGQRSGQNSTMTSASHNRNDIERAMDPPMPLSPTYRMNRMKRTNTTSSDDSTLYFGSGTGNVQFADGREGVPLRQLHPKESEAGLEANDSDKALQVLGMHAAGLSTEVTGGSAPSLSGEKSRTKANTSLAGIEVERSVVVTSTHVDKHRY